MKLVLDNSVALRWCFGDGSATDLDYAAGVASALQTQEAIVPAPWSLEVANVLARAELRGLVTAEHSSGFLALLRDMRITTDPGTAVHALAETLDLARQHHLSAYDAAYLELALRERLPLATLDTALRQAAAAAGARLFG